jgi:hypothetical protein
MAKWLYCSALIGSAVAATLAALFWFMAARVPIRGSITDLDGIRVSTTNFALKEAALLGRSAAMLAGVSALLQGVALGLQAVS